MLRIMGNGDKFEELVNQFQYDCLDYNIEGAGVHMKFSLMEGDLQRGHFWSSR